MEGIKRDSSVFATKTTQLLSTDYIECNIFIMTKIRAEDKYAAIIQREAHKFVKTQYKRTRAELPVVQKGKLAKKKTFKKICPVAQTPIYNTVKHVIRSYLQEKLDARSCFKRKKEREDMDELEKAIDVVRTMRIHRVIDYALSDYTKGTCDRGIFQHMNEWH